MKKIHIALFYCFIALLTLSCQEEMSIEVTSVTIKQAVTEMTVGETIQLSAEVLPSDAADKTVSWTSSNEKVMTVSSSGKVVAIAEGQSSITAKAGSKSDVITITVVPRVVHVSGITLDKSSITLKVGESETLTPTIVPEDATNKNVVWNSSNKEVASVDLGTVLAVAPGTATITAQTEDGAMKAECIITVKPNLAPSVTIGADHISAISAVVQGEANLDDTMSSDMTMGIMWSTSSGVLPSNSTKVEAKDISAKQGYDASYTYSLTLKGLTPDTKYYYRSYVTQKGEDTYGETKDFTTNSLTSLIETKDATNVLASSACLNAKLDLTDVAYDSIEWGFYWGATEDSQNEILKGSEISGNSFNAPLTSLSHKTRYWFKGYVKLDEQSYFGAVLPFTTDVVLVESVVIEPSSYVFDTIGSSKELVATVSPADATDKSVEWTTDNDKVATVDKNGKVTSVGNGTANITVTTKDQNKKATCNITVAQQITQITLDHNSVEMNEGEVAKITASSYPETAANKSITWSSNNEDIAKVDQEGNITAISKGTATIKAEASDGGGVYATCAVTVKRLVTSIVISNTNLTVNVGKSLTLNASVTPSDASNTSVSWSSSDKSIASINESGVVTGVSAGSVIITATAKDGSNVKTECVVSVVQPVTGIDLDKLSISLLEGESYTFTITIYPENASNKEVTWSSYNENVATVDDNGKVTAIAKGSAIITATAKDGSGVYKSCEVTVIKPASSISLNYPTLTIYPGKTETLTATILPAEASDQYTIWTCSNQDVLTTTTYGKNNVSLVIKGKSVGVATITAKPKYGPGVQAECVVTVAPLVSEITLDRTFVTLRIGSECTLSVKSILPENACEKSVTWSSLNEQVASVDQSGKVKAISDGNTTILATAKDGSNVMGACSITVKESAPNGAVDMGLSVCWASSNIGANSPEAYGDFYAWAETTPYYEEGHSQDNPCSNWRTGKEAGYDWPSYTWANGSQDKLTRYCPSDKSSYWDGYGGTLGYTQYSDYNYQDDVARSTLGGSWRIPTLTEINELTDNTNCKWEWTTQKGVPGYLVTSLITNNSIFLPAVGQHYGKDIIGAGSSAGYWSASIDTRVPFCAYRLYFNSDGPSSVSNDRTSGFAIRPVVE